MTNESNSSPSSSPLLVGDLTIDESVEKAHLNGLMPDGVTGATLLMFGGKQRTVVMTSPGKSNPDTTQKMMSLSSSPTSFQNRTIKLSREELAGISKTASTGTSASVNVAKPSIESKSIEDQAKSLRAPRAFWTKPGRSRGSLLKGESIMSDVDASASFISRASHATATVTFHGDSPWIRVAKIALLAAAVAFGGWVAIRGLSRAPHGAVAPAVLAANDPRVVQAAVMRQDAAARRDELLLQKADLTTRLVEATQWVELEDAFQASFKAAMASDLAEQRAELRRAQKVLADRAADPVAKLDTMNANTDATKIDPVKVELEARIAAANQRISLLEAASRDGKTRRYDVLAFTRERDRSRAAADRSRELATALTKAITDTDALVKEKDALLASIDASPYRLAMNGDVTLGFVPYEDGLGVRAGDTLFACNFGRFLCHPAGHIAEFVSGEVRSAHPFTGKEVRGRFAHLVLTDPHAAERTALIADAPH